MSHCSPSPGGTGHRQITLGHLFLAPCVSRASDTSHRAARRPPARAPAAAAAGSRARQRGRALPTPIAFGPQSGCKGVRRERGLLCRRCWEKPVVGTAAGHPVSVPPRAAALRGEAAAAREKGPSWEMLPEKSPGSSGGSGAARRAGRAQLQQSQPSLQTHILTRPE